MLVVISPAKRLDWAERNVASTEPTFQEDAVRLSKTMRNLTLGDLRKLMDLSPDLAKLNRDRFKTFEDAVVIHSHFWQQVLKRCGILDLPPIQRDGM